MEYTDKFNDKEFNERENDYILFSVFVYIAHGLYLKHIHS